MKISKFIIFCLIAFVAPVSYASESLGGISFPKNRQIQGEERVLNGLGLRLATFFKVKVYVAGLYVKQASTDPGFLLNDEASKLMRMVMLRDLKAEQLKEALQEGFEKACVETECETHKESVASFVALQPNIKKGEALEYEFQGTRIIVRHDEKILGSLDVPTSLTSVLLRLWLGDHPPNSELKEGLLGLKKN